MRYQKINQLSFLLAFVFVLLSCEKDDVGNMSDAPADSSETSTLKYIDSNGEINSLKVSGSRLIYTDQYGSEKSFELNSSSTANDHSARTTSDVSQISGHLETEFRGKLQVNYKDGKGKVFWKMREDVTIWGEIECINTVRDQIILDILITKSTASDPFAVGQKIVTTVRDLGNPGQEIKDQIAKVILIYARPDECLNPFLPDVNDLIGYDDAGGNIVTK